MRFTADVMQECQYLFIRLIQTEIKNCVRTWQYKIADGEPLGGRTVSREDDFEAYDEEDDFLN